MSLRGGDLRNRYSSAVERRRHHPLHREVGSEGISMFRRTDVMAQDSGDDVLSRIILGIQIVLIVSFAMRRGLGNRRSADEAPISVYE